MLLASNINNWEKQRVKGYTNHFKGNTQQTRSLGTNSKYSTMHPTIKAYVQ